MAGATLLMREKLVAVDRIRLSARLCSELQQEAPDYKLLKMINTVLRQELEPFDFRHKLVLTDQLRELGVTADASSQKILTVIPDFMQDAIEDELEMLEDSAEE